MATLKGKKVGTSTITASYGSLTSNGVVLTVSALDLSLSGTNCVISGLSNITYNGSAHKTHPTVTANVGGTQTTLTEGTDYTLGWSSSDSNACTAVGTITVTVTGKGNFSGSKTATYQITNATITVKTSGKTSVTNQSYTYSGSAQGVGLVATTVNNQTATIKYKVGSSGTYSTTVPQITNVAQSTIIYYEVTAPNHSTATGSYSLTITNKSISIPTPTGATKTYDGNAYSATFPAATGATVTKYRYDANGGSSWTESTTLPTRTNVGTTTVQAYYSANTNYSGSDWSSTASIKINAADFTVTASNQTYPWNGSAQGAAITVTNLKGSQPATIKYRTTSSGDYNLTSAPQITNVSQSPLTVYWQVTASNHNTQTGSYTITITAPAISIPAPTSNEKTYTGTTYYATFPAASYATITGYQTSTNGTSWSDAGTSNPGKSTQGTIYVRAYYTADGNHSGSGYSAAATIKINPATITVTASNQSYPYDGAAHGNAISATTVNSQTATIQYKVGSSGTYSTTVPKVTVVGNNATIYYQATAPNHSTVTGSYTLSITTVAITATATDQSKVYDGYPLSAAATGTLNKALPSGHTVTYGVSGSQTNVGSSTKTLSSVTIKNGSGTDVSANYDITRVNGSLVVTNASFTVSAPNQTYIYNGSAQGAAITVTNLKGSQTATIKYGTTSGTYDTTTVPTQTTANPGSPKTVYWQVTAPNHDPQTGSYTITVNRATPTFTLTGDTKVYHTTAYIKATASVAGTVHWGTSSSSMTSTTTVSAGTATNVTSRGDSDGVGTTTIYAYFTPTDTTNYNSVGSSSSYAESAAAKTTASTDNNISVTVSSGLAYTGANQVIATKTGGEGCASFTLGYSTTSGGAVTWGTENATTLSVAGPGTYYIHYKVNPDTNHSTTITDKQLDGTVVISEGTLTITITGYSGTYDATAHNIVASGPTAKNQTGATVTGVTYSYSTSENGTYSTSLTRTNATGTASNENATATYWVKAEKSGYTTAKKSFTVYIARAANPLTISPTSKTIYNTSGYNTFTITPSGAQGGVTYSSNATSKASVNSSGVVTYVSAGTGTVITVTAAGNDNYKSGSKTCTVNTVVDTVSTYGDITGNITISQKKQFPAGGVALSTSNISTYFDYSSTAAQTLTWVSGNTTSGSISHAWSGTSVTIPSLGTSETSTTTERTISFTVTATGEGSKTKSASVSKGNQEANPVTGISLALAQTTIVYGNTTTTTVTATYKSGSTGTITPTSVSSSDTTVAEVL